MRAGRHLVGVAFDDDDTGVALRRRFGPWLDPQPARLGFGVRTATGGTGRGLRRLAVLTWGASTVVARAREPGPVLDALAGHLGGVAALADDDRPRLSARVLTRGDRAVVLDAAFPELVGDRGLADAGVVEAACWAAVVAEPGVLALPPPLGSAAGRVVRVLGAVTHTGAARPAEVLARLTGLATAGGAWFATAAALVAEGRVVVGHGRADLRAAVVNLLGR